MNRKNLIAAAALLCLSVSALPVAAADYGGDRPACLQNNRIFSWDVLNDRTLMVRDSTDKRFVVHLRGGCVGLSNATNALRFRTFTRLSCLSRGDSIAYYDQAFGHQMSCFVEGVEASAAPREGGGNDRYRDRSYAPSR